ncbi:MAG: hypothetical protein DRI95_15430 [Bacteroidetes bacterium]|nr:MAG: hypothetical protein DRI95_15430 [Bacteroidota bacterium]
MLLCPINSASASIAYESLWNVVSSSNLSDSALAKTYSLTSFGSRVRLFERLGNVYGFSEGIDIAITKI